jgi:hypothetical protein
MTLASRTSGGVVAVGISAAGTGYTAPPSVAFSGGGGAGAAAVAHMAGTQVESIVITNAGTGYSSAPSVSLSGGGGTGAAATAAVFSGTLLPMSFFQGRSGEVYGVDGAGRGIRIDCGATQAISIGVQKPQLAPAVTASAFVFNKQLAAIQLVRRGIGYHATPTITLSGGTPTTPATARAVMNNGRLDSIVVETAGSGYQAAPSVGITGGFAVDATFGVTVSGRVDEVQIRNGGSGYTSNETTTPAVVFSTAQGLFNAYAVPLVDERGRISTIQVLAAGTGATTTGVTATITGGGGSGASLSVDMRYTVTGATVTYGGSRHSVPPVLTFRSNRADATGFGAQASAIVANQVVTGVTVTAGGDYALPPSLVIEDTRGEAEAVMEPVLRGSYFCAVRYVDQGRDTVSAISDLTEVNAIDGSDSLSWSFTHTAVDPRVTAMELWRTSANQAVLLYRVATIQKTDAAWSAGYTDTTTDRNLIDAERDGYAMMPVTLPSGALNARRFGVLPGNYAVGVMFQDRAWFAADTSGNAPNSLMFSEVDEPESVPFENEIVLQENAGERDSIVTLVPLGGEMLIAQTGHLYSLRYVAQPVIDASFTLVAYRGALNSRCAAVLGGVAFFADSYGMYAFDGSQEKPISAAVDNYWREGIIDFSKSHLFHVSTDYDSKIVRFHYCQSGDSEPTRALCHCLATEAWWEEEYPVAVTASAPAVIAGRRSKVFGSGAGGFFKAAGTSDTAGSISWLYRSGNMVLNKDPTRSIGFVYTPTANAAPLQLSLHYNGSTAARTNAVASNQGAGFASAAGATQAVLDMASTRSALGPATGYAQAMFAGRLDPRSAGADRHVAIGMAGTQTGSPVKIHGVTVEGVG